MPKSRQDCSIKKGRNLRNEILQNHPLHLGLQQELLLPDVSQDDKSKLSKKLGGSGRISLQQVESHLTLTWLSSTHSFLLPSPIYLQHFSLASSLLSPSLAGLCHTTCVLIPNCTLLSFFLTFSPPFYPYFPPLPLPVRRSSVPILTLVLLTSAQRASHSVVVFHHSYFLLLLFVSPLIPTCLIRYLKYPIGWNSMDHLCPLGDIRAN